jgi:hypothetical protein
MPPRPPLRMPLWPALTLAALHLFGCIGPGPIHDDRPLPPALAEIRRAYEHAVASRRSSPDAAWRSGWTGNVAVHLSGRRDLGLCHQWRDAVYRGIIDTARARGWSVRGLIVNWGTWLEHHAVVVYDPATIRDSHLLTSPPPRPAWVLDAWSRGRADIWTLDDWLRANPSTLREPHVVDISHLDSVTDDRAPVRAGQSIPQRPIARSPASP